MSHHHHHHEVDCPLTQHAHVGVEVVQQIVTQSTIGVGPRGPEGPVGPAGPEGGTPVVTVPYAEWPPAAPVDGTLYLRIAEEGQ